MGAFSRWSQLQAVDQDDGSLALDAKRIGGPLLFARLWQELGIGEVLGGLLAAREFSFAVERAVFAATLHRLFVLSSDRDCVSWMADYYIGGAEALGLHHLYRAMEWLGETAEAASGASRRVASRAKFPRRARPRRGYNLA